MTTATEAPTTESVIAGMLQENTGRHMLDSGGAYGRNWERNQGVDFGAQPATALSFKYGGIEVTHDAYHWLVERLQYEQEGDEAFFAWADPRDSVWLQDMEAWAELLGATGLYGDGAPFTVNTYNGEDLVSQTLQYTLFNLDRETPLPKPGSEVAQGLDTCTTCQGSGYVSQEQDEDGTLCADCDGDGVVEAKDSVKLSAGTYVLLQVHGGCDVRGGYTRPRLFSMGEHDETGLLDNARATIQCPEDHEHNWSTDDANNWYDDGTSGYGSGTQLEAYDRVEVDFSDDDAVAAASVEGDIAILPEARIGKLVIDTSTDTGYCPKCGVGALSAYA